MDRLTERLQGMAFGGDYNPEQWSPEVWLEDMALMREASVNLVTVGVFAWSLVEPRPGEFDFTVLDQVLDLAHRNDIAVDLATATASPPPWFTRLHPDAMLVDAQGVPRTHGARQAYCPSSPAFREAAARLCSRIVDRYADHPAVVLWHVSNEYGDHNHHCYCDVSAQSFRTWLEQRYGSLAELNRAWGTAVWSQRYADWEDVLPPRAVSYKSFANPTQQLDWWRFSSDEFLALYRAEAAIIRGRSSLPVTTNFMSFFKPINYHQWVGEVDFVSNDDYLLYVDPRREQRTAMAADLMRSLARGKPWLLMEHSTSAVNWQPRNLAKTAGEMRRNSLQHVARGSDGAMFFQWRAATYGAEKFHSAMLPHAGTDTAVWREVCRLGSDLRRLAPAIGSVVEKPRVGIVLDWESWWAAELDSHPTVDATPITQIRRWYGVLWDHGVVVDFVAPDGDLTAYDLVIAPSWYLVRDEDAGRAADFVAAGGNLVLTYFSGVVDENDHVRTGGYPGAFRDVLGLVIEEFAPLLADEQVQLSDGGVGSIWTDRARVTTAEVLAGYVDGPSAGSPAVTRNVVGEGACYYVGTELGEADLVRLVGNLLAGVGIEASPHPPGVEIIRRTSADQAYLFVLNHTSEEALVAASGHELLDDRRVDGELRVPPGGCAVVLEAPPGP
ncbi:beta-galactosidase [Nocardioides sp. MAHUQ-72]|uniref:beta-galactosidase n=1 Tax=unclassified Nocardioides TaxID=2615069 RepID=UPI003611F1F1